MVAYNSDDDNIDLVDQMNDNHNDGNNPNNNELHPHPFDEHYDADDQMNEDDDEHYIDDMQVTATKRIVLEDPFLGRM
jgi:hypothetical protein